MSNKTTEVASKRPNDPKLSDGGAWRGADPTAERTKTVLNANTWRAKIARAVTAVAVRCSALLGVAVEPEKPFKPYLFNW